MTQQQYMQQQMYYQQQQQMYMLQQQQQQQQTMAHQSQHQQANILSIANMTYQQSIHYQQPQNGTTPAAAAPLSSGLPATQSKLSWTHGLRSWTSAGRIESMPARRCHSSD